MQSETACPLLSIYVLTVLGLTQAIEGNYLGHI